MQYLGAHLEPGATATIAFSPMLKVILIVDDEPLIRGFVRKILEENGYAVEEAANVDEALLLLDGNGFAAVPPISKCRGF
jgi:PleD family two-component response regulator